MGKGLATALWGRNRDLAEACLHHPFVQGLGDGSLDRDRFKNYVAQDAYFLEAFVRAYALALARSPDRHGLYALSEMLSGALEELKLHAGYAARWDINMDTFAPGPATLHYTDFLLATASMGSIGDTCAAMTPCMRLYAYLGQALNEAHPQAAHDYAAWINTYSDPGFDDLARTLEELLDRYGEDEPGLHATYRRAMTLERAFFDAALG